MNTSFSNSSYFDVATCEPDYFKFDSCKSFNITTCGVFPCEIKVDPDIGGVGIIYSLIITVWLSWLIAVLITIGDFLAETHPDHSTFQSIYGHWLRDVLEPVALSVSDAAVITGTALLFAGFFRYQGCPISVYHYQLVLLAGYSARWWKTMGLIRGVVLLGFGVMFLRFVDLGHKMPGGKNPFVSLPVSCYYPYTGDAAIVDKNATWNNSGDSLALENGLMCAAFGMAYIVVFLSALGISPWLREKLDRYHLYIPRILIQTLGIGGFAGYYTWKLISDWTAPLGKTPLPPLADSSQSDWGFGQIVPVVLLGAIVLTFVETWRTRESDDDGSPKNSWAISSTGISNLELYGYQNALAKSDGLITTDQPTWFCC
ncbi:hypothetical protein MMC30_002399 [Trapelia coarctata]|nr:hypothetical protein [Trapelia coarctata]